MSKRRAKPPVQPRRAAPRVQPQKPPAEPQKPATQPHKQTVLAASRLDLLIYLALLLATLAVYVQVRHFDFVNYDDPDYTTGNAHIRQGLTMQGLEWALTSHYAANWFPLTWVSHMLDFQLFGADPGWRHLHNVLLHALAAILLCIFLERATGKRWRSALAAFLFALHPLHVESVAWVAERKDVLSACFWFLTLWLYVRYTERPSKRRYLAVALGLCLGLLSKPMVVTLPLVLLLLDYWPLERLGQRWRKAIWEKLPLLALSAAVAAITCLTQGDAGAVNPLPPASRLANATLSYAIYIQKTFWPSRLAVFYPYPTQFAFFPMFAAGLLLAAITAGVIVLRRRCPYLLTGWGWFMVTLVPVIGLVQVGGQARADRYMYIPMVGLLIMLVWGVAEILEKLHSQALAVPLAAAACLACAALTWVQAGYWRNSETLFRHALEATDDNFVVNSYLGNYLMTLPGRQPEALPYLEAAARIDPGSVAKHDDLGAALAKTGHLPDAMAEFQTAIRLDPDAPEPHVNLGAVLFDTGRQPEAVAEFVTALRLDPNSASAHDDLGNALNKGGRLSDAIEEFQAAIRLDPDAWKSHYDLGNALAEAGSLPGAIAEFESALRIDPGSADVHADLGTALAMTGRLSDAIEEFQAAIRLNPNAPATHDDLGNALALAGRLPEASAEFETALRIDPTDANALYDLGVALSQVPGRRPDALRYLEEADRLRPSPGVERAIAQLRAQRQ